MSMSFGIPGSPSDVTLYLDSLVTQTLGNYKKTMTDNIGAGNAILKKIMSGSSYVSEDGGLYIQEPLMYALASSNWYSAYDELGTSPVEGVTAAQWDWSNLANPIVYAMTDIMKNRGSSKLIDMVKTKIKQSEMGIKEDFAQAFMWGNVPNAGALTDPLTDTVTSRVAIDPLPKLISYATTTLTVGNLPELTYTWWRNQSFQSAATTSKAFLLEMLNMYNTCALGTGGAPDLILCDQVTYQLFIAAYFNVYNKPPDNVDMWPFQARKFEGATIVMDDKVPDVFSGTIPTLVGGSGVASSLTYGSMYFVNTQYLKMRYMSGRDFELLRDDNGKAFAKPINGDSRVAHIGWMGNTTISNRRKHGVIGKIARTLT